MLLLDNREVREGWQALKDHVHGLFSKHDCDVKSSRRWDERRLAYPIRQAQRATYLLMYVEAEAAGVDALRRDLRFDEKVIRDLVLRCEQIPEDAYEPEEAFDETAVPLGDAPAEPEYDEGDEESEGDGGGDGEKSGEGAGDEPKASSEGEPEGDPGDNDGNEEEKDS